MSSLIVFAGQGAQRIGMCADLYCKYGVAKELIDKTCEILGYDLKQIMFEGSQEKLNQTIYAQPALLACGYASYLCYNEFTGRDIRATFTAGLSLGEYTSCVYSEVMSYEDCLKLVDKRAKAMQKACEMTKGAMASVLGLETSDVEGIVKQFSGQGALVISNYNAPDQCVIAGEIELVSRASELAKKAGAKRIIPLNVSGAYHSPLMQYAQDIMSAELASVAFADPRYPIISNSSAEPSCSAEEVKHALQRQLISPVKWHQTLDFCVKSGVDTIYEFGPGRVTAGISKRLYPDVKVVAVAGCDDLI